MLTPPPLPPCLSFVSQRFNNFLQLLSCICDIASICFRDIRELARIIDLIADLVYMTTVGCMTVRTGLVDRIAVYLNKYDQFVFSAFFVPTTLVRLEGL